MLGESWSFLLVLCVVGFAILVLAQPRRRWVAAAALALLWGTAACVWSWADRKKEGFTWDPKKTNDFLQMQYVDNRQKVFDVALIQETQASQKELDYYLKHRRWPWSTETTRMYEEAVLQNPYVRTFTQDSVDDTRKLYNDAAIRQVLFWQSPEGRFLTHGYNLPLPEKKRAAIEGSGVGSFAYTGGLLGSDTGGKPVGDLLRCGPQSGKLERVKTGPLGLLGEETIEAVEPVNPMLLPSLVPGFQFTGSPGCDPCKALQGNWTCPFKLSS